MMEPVLEKVKDFADAAHGEQSRKYSGERYITHPVRVMETCRSYGYSLPVLAAALLHDVLEDTGTDPQTLRQFLSGIMDKASANDTIRLVIELTDVYTKKEFPRLNRRTRKAREAARLAGTSPEAQTIKYADIIDNCRAISGEDSDFAPVFLRECKMLLQKMTNGHPELRNRAIKLVEEELGLLKRQE